MTDSDCMKCTIRKPSKYKRDLSKFSDRDALSSEQRSTLEGCNPMKFQSHLVLSSEQGGFALTKAEREFLQKTEFVISGAVKSVVVNLDIDPAERRDVEIKVVPRLEMG